MKKFKQKGDLGKCQFCGSPIREFQSGWGCVGTGCGAYIYRDNIFFRKLMGERISRSTAVKLLQGDPVSLYGVTICGRKLDVGVSFGLSDSGSYKYKYFVWDLEKKKKGETVEITGFDLLNGEWD